MEKNNDEVIFPVALNLSEMRAVYMKFIEGVKVEIQKQCIFVVLNANSSMICLYCSIGIAILKNRRKKGGVQKSLTV